jgi:8-oxo-dGTP pyrophosphatase MutT (NUDIX family)
MGSVGNRLHPVLRTLDAMGDRAADQLTPASTVALLRDVEGGVEVCMLRRPNRSSFAAGAFVFPGGALDRGDGTGELAYAMAGVREVLEEVGILIGGPAPGSGDDRLDERVAVTRAEVLEGSDFAATLAAHDLVVTPELLVYIGHFITPPREGRRYDTRFFALPVSDHQEVRVHAAEAVEGGWHRPESMLSLTMPAIMPPTRMMCHEFARLGSVQAIVDTLGAHPIEVTSITPEIIASWLALEHEPPGPS